MNKEYDWEGLTPLLKAIKEQTIVQEKLASPWRSLVRGIFYGFGVFIGSALLISAAVYALSSLNSAPLVGSYISKIISVIENRR